MADRTMTWIDVNGVATVLDGSSGILLQANPVGLEAPNPTNTIDEYAVFDGGVLANRRHPVRSIALGLYLEHDTRVETVTAALAKMLQGPGQLRWSDDVNTRTLRQVIYEAGIDGSGDTNRWQRTLVASMIALDPWWYGLPVSTELAVAPPTAFDAPIAFDAFVPFDGGDGTAVTIDGDADAWPVFTITGPATTLTVASNGQQWSIAAPLAAGAVLVVDHRPGSRGPSFNGGAVDWSLLTEASRLWPLDSGTATVVTGSTGSTGATTIVMSWEPRFLTP